MKVLWITNMLLPEANSMLNSGYKGKSSESWVYSMATGLENFDISLFVATVSPLVNELKVLYGKHITYYILPQQSIKTKYCNKYERYWIEIKEIIKPDIVHIHGTERPIGLSYVKSCGIKGVVVSMQGLVSIIERYFYAGLSWKERHLNITIHDIIRSNSLYSIKKEFVRCGKYERELLSNIENVIGRTSWDKSHLWEINPNCKYFYCGEILREPFFHYNWEFKNCLPFTILLSQANTPLKGAHQVFKALPIIQKKYPQAKILVAGEKPTENKTFGQKVRIRTYGKYLLHLMETLNISDSIEFLGYLSSEEMAREMCKANVFVLPSSIENSPNSLGEAQLVGVPCISSNVGGVADFIPDEQCGVLYRYEEIEMLAYYICEVFKYSNSYDNSRMKKLAYKRHNKEDNIKTLINIYKNIVENK